MSGEKFSNREKEDLSVEKTIYTYIESILKLMKWVKVLRIQEISIFLL